MVSSRWLVRNNQQSKDGLSKLLKVVIMGEYHTKDVFDENDKIIGVEYILDENGDPIPISDKVREKYKL
jgi:hypothetical protein